jgi:glycosyltransferase involved in cell wall biosynthesis
METMDAVKQPLISVIMPAYNTESFIEEAIDSIINQTYPYFELLICDDGSTDKTHAIAEAYAARDTRIRVFRNKKNIGNLKTTNFLFSQCRGEYIAVQDSDDISHEKRLEVLLDELQADLDLGIAGANYTVFESKNKFIFSGFLPLTNEQIKKVMQKEVPPILWGACLFRKNVLEQAGFFRPIFKRNGFADLDLLYRMCEVSSCKNNKQVLYYYRKSSPSKYPAKGIFPEHGLDILVEAHHMRSAGQVDFIDSADPLAIRRFVSRRIFRRAEQSQWAGDFKTARKLYFHSFLLHPANVMAVKNVLKMMIAKRGEHE